ncbi:phosphoribosyltransferase [Sorangium sp. So ce1128]
MSEIITMSWQEVDQLAELLRRALSGVEVDVVLGISRSGLVPAVMLSHRLGVRDFAVLDIRRTESDDIESSKSLPTVCGLLDTARLQGRRVLLVDDIVGEGLTMMRAREVLTPLCDRLVSVTLVVNQRNLGMRSPCDVVDYHACIVHGWVTFPWERY